MSEYFLLQVEARKTSEKIPDLLTRGLIPAVANGRVFGSRPIKIRRADFHKVWKSAGESAVVNLQLGGESIESLISEVQLHPVSGEIIHADFYVFEKGHKIEVSVPLEFVGVSPAVKELGGILNKVLHELKIKASSKDLPAHIEVDISGLVNIDDHITAEMIVLPSGVELEETPHEIVVNVSAPKEETTTPTLDVSAIEVEKKGKKEEEE